MTIRRRTLIGIGIGAAITPIAAAMAIASAGAGHGHYVLAKLLFPYSMLLTKFANDTISQPLVVLAVAQFPLYGLAGASLSIGRKGLIGFSALALLHFVSAGACFLGLIPSFS